ncbi:MAG TPA: enoyl-CoA hydratase/isomerase family protein [Myxococcales bacterium]|jgi:enoyl-CoA hydratase/carnithine racemase|nr:enoyl-CoA hydratase/isomerase family protein [Myxococcales bacterium]
MSANDEILYEVKEDGIAWLTFNRPQARNAMTFGMYDRLGQICREINSDDSLKALVLRGAGNKAFVSGTDISQFRDFSTPQHAIDYEARMDRVFDALEEVRVPTIAAIQGACTGGGAGIAAACDLRLGAPSAKFGFPIARTLGNTLSTRNYARLAALIGVARTKDIILLARLMDAEEMRAAGLLNEITTEEGLYARADEMAHTVAEHAPITIRTAKQQLNRIVRHWAPPGEREHVIQAYTSDDFREGIEAFLAKRKPRWRGK